MPAPNQPRLALITVTLASFVTPLLLSGVNVAIPAIVGELRTDALLTSWIPSAYLLATAVCLLPAGRLGDIYGRRRVYAVGLGTLFVTSLTAATAASIESLIAYRVLQGAGSALQFACGSAILTSIYPREQRGSVLGIQVSAVYVGLTCGPLMGGWVTEAFGWRGVFLYYLPLTALALLLTLALKGEWRSPEPERFDLPGTASYAVALIGIMLGLSQLPHLAGFGLLLGGLVGLQLFGLTQRRAAHPLFDVRLLLSNQLFTFSCLAALFIYAAVFGTSYLMSLYLQYSQGLSAPAAGMVMMAQPIMMALLAPFSGRLSDRVEPRWIVSAGMAMTAVGLTLLSRVDDGTHLTYVIVALTLSGLGFALFASPNANAILSSVEKRQLGTASGSMGTVRAIGQMLSMGIVTVVFATVMGDAPFSTAHHEALLTSIQRSFLIMAAVCLPAMYVSLARGRVHARPAPRE